MKTIWALIAGCALLTGRAAGTEPLVLTHTIPLPGIVGRFDHFACDPVGQRLVVAALGNDTAEIFDLVKFSHRKSLPGLSKPTGALIIAESKQLFVANGNEGTLRAFNAVNYEPTAQIGELDDADNVRFDATAKLVYVGFGDGALGVVDPMSGRLLGSIPLAAHPEAFQLETKGARIFVNVPNAKQIAIVDRAQKTVIAKWPMEKWHGNFPMALDEPKHRLFVGCRQPARLVVIDTEKGTAVSDLEISGDADDVFYDAKRQRIYVSCGEGFLDVIQGRDGDRYERLTRIATREGARTCFFSPELDLLFLAVPKRLGSEGEIRVYQPQ
jgi:hypothetical protein